MAAITMSTSIRLDPDASPPPHVFAGGGTSDRQTGSMGAGHLAGVLLCGAPLVVGVPHDAQGAAVFIEDVAP